MFGQGVRKHYGSIGAILLLLVFLCELTLSVRQQSLSWDEGDHIFAGYMSWKDADFGINPEHPPLVKAVATVPLLAMHIKVPPPEGLSNFKLEAFADGRDFIFDNGGEAEADRIVFRARMAAACLSLLLGLIVFLAGREMFGIGAGLFALALFVFEPNVIAHGAYVTTDMGLSCFMFASIYALYRYVKMPSWGRLMTLGLASGLALASKHSAVVLLPIGLSLLFIEILWSQSDSRANGKAISLRLTGAFLTASIVALLVLWTFYGFRYVARPGGLYLHPSLADYAEDLRRPEAHVYLTLAHWHILPESYLYGLVDIRRISNSASYMFGKAHPHGLWFYFPVVFVIKSTAAFIGLLVLAGFAIITKKLQGRREIFFLSLPPVLYFLIAMANRLNLGVRHILPIYPFLCVLIGGAALALAHLDRRWAYVTGVLLAWHIVSSARTFPNYLAYSNEFWGGPANTYRYLTNSDTDWGQELKAVKKYLDHRDVKNCWFAYYPEPSVHFSAYGIPCKRLPTPDTQWAADQIDTPTTITGTVLISATTLTDPHFGANVLNPYYQFQKLHPVAYIQDGVFVYDGTFDMHFASALGHVTRATNLIAAKQLTSALAEAQAAVAIDPETLQAQMILGNVLMAIGRPAAARSAYEKALSIAKGLEPDFAAEWIPKIQEKLTPH